MRNNFMKIKTLKIFLLILVILFSGSFMPRVSDAQQTCDNDPACNFTANCDLSVQQFGNVLDIGWSVSMSPRTTDYDYTNGIITVLDATGFPVYSNTQTGDGQVGGNNSTPALAAGNNYRVTLDGSIEAWGTYTDTCSQTIYPIDIAATCTDPAAYNYNQSGSCVYACSKIDFSATSVSLPNPNSGTNLSFALNRSYPWYITLDQGGILPAPQSGTDSSRSGITTGALPSTQIYRLHCTDNITNPSWPVTVNVAGSTPPPAGVCTDPAADNFGGPLPCVTTPPPTTPGSLCSPMTSGAAIRGGACSLMSNGTSGQSSSSNCLSWCNGKGADGCELYNGTCYAFSGADCYVEYGYSGSASVDICPTPPVYITPSVSNYPACIPQGQTTYTATINWAPTVANNIRIFLNNNLLPYRDYDKVLSGLGGSTSVPSGFVQRTGPAQAATLVPGATYTTFVQNNGYDGPSQSWSVPQCNDTHQQAEGYLDAGNCSIFGGWAWDPDYPNGNPATDDDGAMVFFLKDGSPGGSIKASAYRGDLPGAGIGDGYHAFTYPTPDTWKDGSPHTITGYIVDFNGDGNGTLVSNIGTPVVVNCPDPDDSDMTGTLSGPATCSIPLNGSDCSPSPVLAWSIDNPEVATTKITWSGGSTNVSTSITPASQNGTKAVTLSTPGSQTFTLENNSKSLDTKTVTALCVSGAEWSVSQNKCVGGSGLCNEANATNNGGPLPCVFPPNICDEEEATNYGEAKPCVFPMDSRCGNYDDVDPCPTGDLIGEINEGPVGWTWQCSDVETQCIYRKTGKKLPIFIED
jgi:hypothetical protein